MSGAPGAGIAPADRPGSWVVRLDDRAQSHVDLDDPTRLVFDYVRRIGDVIDAAAPPGAPLQALHVGGAGMTLPRYVAATRPGSRQVVLEPDTALTDLVRAELPLPGRSGRRGSGVSVRPVPGRVGLAEVRDAWAEVVVVDAFAAGEVPDDLVTVQSWRELDRVSADGAPVVINVSDGAPFARTRDVVAGMREVFGALAAGVELATWRGRRSGNLVLVAGAAAPAGDDAAYRWLVGDALSDALGGGTPRHDHPPGPAAGPSRHD